MKAKYMSEHKITFLKASVYTKNKGVNKHPPN